jgi:hypothetical protein
MTRDDEVQAALDELFATPPEEFVAARNALVKRLKADKRPAEAGYVGALRKPNRLVWALNQLALTEHDSLQDLLDAADDVRDGGGDDLKGAMVDLRDAVNAAATAATARFDPARVSDRADLAQALLAIVSDEEATIELSEGRLQDVPPPDAFGLGLAEPAAPRPKPKPKAKAAPKASARAEAPPVDQLAVRRATKHQKEAAKADDSAQRALARAEKALAADVAAREEADTELASTTEEVDQLEAALDAARKALADAESAAAKAVDAQERSAAALSEAQAKADAAATALDEATAELEALGGS